MNEPWISQETLGLLIMAIFIPLGPLVGTLGWLFVQKGKTNRLTIKAKKLTLGVIAFGFVMGFIFLVFGVIAFFFRTTSLGMVEVWFLRIRLCNFFWRRILVNSQNI